MNRTTFDAFEARRDELVREALDFLRAVRTQAEDNQTTIDDGSIDVRLYLRPEGSTDHEYGDASYDTDHRGGCGAASVKHGDSEDTLEDVATDLVDEALESASELAEASDLEGAPARVRALAAHLECLVSEVEECRYGEGQNFEAEGGEFYVLTDEEADEKTHDYISETLWTFNASFLASYMPEGIDTEEIDAIRGDRCEDANGAILALVNAGPWDLDTLVQDAIDADGRGHMLAGYDGHEHEVEVSTDDGDATFYIYRVN